MRGGHQALFGVKQLLQEMQTLAVVVEQVKGDAYAIRGMQLPQIAHVQFGRAAGMSALLDAGEPASEQLEHLVHGAIEQRVVVGLAPLTRRAHLGGEGARPGHDAHR
jgi:hypothetical protein